MALHSAKTEVRRCSPGFYTNFNNPFVCIPLDHLMSGRWTHRLAPYLKLDKCASPAQYRQISSHVSGRILKGDDLGPTREDACQTFRVRKDEGSKDLPLPPLLDPVILESRSRWEQTKQRPRAAEFTPFQKKLQENPFGKQSNDCRESIVLTPSSARIGIACSSMSHDTDLASYRIPHVSTCPPASYNQRSMAPPCFSDNQREAPWTTSSIRWPT